MHNHQRRNFIKHTAAAAATIAIGQSYANEPSPACIEGGGQVPFYGTHQSGIATPVQKHLYFMVLDLDTTERIKIKNLFRTWTSYSGNLMKGKNVRPYLDNIYTAPNDSGEADNLNAYHLTLTFGLGPSFFDKLELTHLKPKGLQDLPLFVGDQLNPYYTGGDICIQACADDPQVAFHAVRNLLRSGKRIVKPRWSQMGFNAFAGSDTPRNLFGFKDGTANPKGADLDNAVWVNETGWLQQGTYLVARRIRMFLEKWDDASLNDQQQTFGRYRTTGAPIGKQGEFEAVDLNAKNEKGELHIPVNSHVHLANNTQLQMLRRSYSYVAGVDQIGELDAGLLFLSYQKDPEIFIKMQQAFGHSDKMNEFIRHIGSGLFACFGGVQDENDYLGRVLFEQL